MFELRQCLLGIDFCGLGTFGKFQVIYPEPTEESRAMSLLMEAEPIRLMRRSRRPAGGGGLLEQYAMTADGAESSRRWGGDLDVKESPCEAADVNLLETKSPEEISPRPSRRRERRTG